MITLNWRFTQQFCNTYNDLMKVIPMTFQEIVNRDKYSANTTSTNMKHIIDNIMNTIDSSHINKKNINFFSTKQELISHIINSNGNNNMCEYCTQEGCLCDGNIGLPRICMPQCEGQKSTLIRDSIACKKAIYTNVTWVSMIPEFLVHLVSCDISVNTSFMHPFNFISTQNEIFEEKVRGILLKFDPNKWTPIIVSRTGHILDGHHRAYAAKLYYSLHKINKKLSVYVVDDEINHLVDVANEYADSVGIPRVGK
jgi:hypothetical protein